VDLQKKLYPDDTIKKYKVTLVAKGFSQKECINFFDIYARVCIIITIKVLIA